ncbi:MAG: hypothetical protein V1745_04295 [Patescibacteria group bacterium]
MNYRFSSLCSALALLAAACGGTDTGNGDGGGGTGSNCQSVGCGNGGGGGTSSGTTTGTGTGTGTGGSDVCNPTPENNNCASASSCECLPIDTTKDSWCSAYDEISVYICPDTGDVCTPGHNQCGYDLPEGVDYEPADATCKGFVNGDVWAGNNVQSGFDSDVDENGQTHVGFGSMFGGAAEYYYGFIMSGKKFYWNRFNAAQYESGEGEIADDCLSVEIRFYGGGSTTPYKTYTATHVHQ